VHGPILIAYIVSWVMAFFMFANLFGYSRRAYKYAGTSKLRWLGAVVVSVFLPVGLLFIAWYAIRYDKKIRYADREKLNARAEQARIKSTVRQHVETELRHKGF
jgi:hypothetical protein